MLIEQILFVPGMRTLLLEAMVLCCAIVIVTAHLVVALLYAWLDARMRYA
jgi:ABC-type dipeptide/oligopeptide/nickel transport system permease component